MSEICEVSPTGRLTSSVAGPLMGGPSLSLTEGPNQGEGASRGGSGGRSRPVATRTHSSNLDFQPIKWTCSSRGLPSSQGDTSSTWLGLGLWLWLWLRLCSGLRLRLGLGLGFERLEHLGITPEAVAVSRQHTVAHLQLLAVRVLGLFTLHLHHRYLPLLPRLFCLLRHPRLPW